MQALLMPSVGGRWSWSHDEAECTATVPVHAWSWLLAGYFPLLTLPAYGIRFRPRRRGALP
jgi:hypothetical protein